MFIQTEDTPNPTTLKFIPGRDVMGDAMPVDFPNIERASVSPLARCLFEVSEVSSVFLGADFIAITKQEGEWEYLKPRLLTMMMDFFISGLPVMEVSVEAMDRESSNNDTQDSDVVATIKQLLDTRVRPAVARDGGDIVFHGFEDGIVTLHMRGACAGCPSSTATLKGSIENLLKHFVPEVKEVRPVE